MGTGGGYGIRLIDADALFAIGKARKIIEVIGNWQELPGPAKSACVRLAVAHKRMILNAPTVEAIPIAVIKRAIAGISAADQCDQAGRYELELRDALNTVLKWYGSPGYKEHEKRTGHG